MSEIRINLLSTPFYSPAHLHPTTTPTFISFSSFSLFEITSLILIAPTYTVILIPFQPHCSKIFRLQLLQPFSPSSICPPEAPLPSSSKLPLSLLSLKRPSLYKDILRNYCPISYFSVITKITERGVKICLLDHLASNHLLNPNQSAHTKHHWTDTTLLSLHNHLSNTISHQQVSRLNLHDLFRHLWYHWSIQSHSSPLLLVRPIRRVLA